MKSWKHMIRALLVDDHPAFLTIIQAELANLRPLTVVACAQCGRDAVALAQQLQPDLVILDIAMPDMNGLEVARRIKAQARTVAVVMVSMHDTPAYRAASASVADGFVTKDALDIHLLPLVAGLFPGLTMDADGEGDKHLVGG
jgi:DNA-binding NarL/FixJ family response regulator